MPLAAARDAGSADGWHAHICAAELAVAAVHDARNALSEHTLLVIDGPATGETHESWQLRVQEAADGARAALHSHAEALVAVHETASAKRI